eukprot:c24920_g1_i2 orf=47-2401(+)
MKRMVSMEVVRQKLEQLWGIIRKWGVADIITWAFSRLGHLFDIFKIKLASVKWIWHKHQLFPITSNERVPNPSSLWSPSLKARVPLPTNTAWLNFALNEGSMPEYIHPYVIRCKQGVLSICFPSPAVEPHAITQAFVPDISIGCTMNGDSPSVRRHMITAFDDLSVTLELHGGIKVPLVRGCPYITFIFTTMVMPTFATEHKVTELISNESHTRHKISFENGQQTWIIYSSNPLSLEQDSDSIKVNWAYKGHIRVVLLKGGAEAEKVLDEHAGTYPVGGRADLSVPFQVSYTWEMDLADKKLLMLSLPIHRDMMAHNDDRRPSVAYDGIDGKMEAISSNSWLLKTSNISTVGWHCIGGNIQKEKRKKELEAVLRHDMSMLMPLPENIVSAYSHGKFMARVARMAVIAEEVGSCLDLLKQAREFLTESLTAWLEGRFRGNALVYDSKWGGIIASETHGESADTSKGVYDDARYTLGYFCYAGAVLAKLDEAWGKAHKAQLYKLMSDYMNAVAMNKLEPHADYVFPRLRHFDLWVLHSWGGDGLVESEYGRRQLSSSEAVHAYYAGAMLGLAFNDKELVNLGLTLASLEIKAAQLLWHIPSSSSLYPVPFSSQNRMIKVLWANKRESLGPLPTPPSITDDANAQHTNAPTRTSSTTMHGSASQTKLAIPSSSSTASMEIEMPDGALLLPHHLVSMQVSPLVPISKILFSNTAFAKELVDWALPYLSTPHTTSTWKGHVYALQALYDQSESTRKNVFALSYRCDENCLSILVWWIYSREAQSNETHK